MLLAKTFTVPVEPVVKPAADVTPTQKPFFDPGATTSNLPVEISLPVEKSGPYPMDHCLSGRRRPARQTSEKDVLCFHRQVGP